MVHFPHMISYEGETGRENYSGQYDESDDLFVDWKDIPLSERYIPVQVRGDFEIGCDYEIQSGPLRGTIGTLVDIVILNKDIKEIVVTDPETFSLLAPYIESDDITELICCTLEIGHPEDPLDREVIIVPAVSLGRDSRHMVRLIESDERYYQAHEAQFWREWKSSLSRLTRLKYWFRRTFPTLLRKKSKWKKGDSHKSP